MKIEQLSFLQVVKRKPKYDATICYRCRCMKCKYNVEIFPILSREECKTIGDKSCFNCDECYYFGMDDESLNMDKVRFHCDKFKMSSYWVDVKAKLRRMKFKVIKNTKKS